MSPARTKTSLAKAAEAKEAAMANVIRSRVQTAATRFLLQLEVERNTGTLGY